MRWVIPLVLTASLAWSCSDDKTTPPSVTLKYTTPGCDPACPDGQVCKAGTCESPGPKKTCGSDKWPASLPASNVLYVDGAVATTGDGTKDKPFKTVAEAVTASSTSAESTVAIAPGTYAEALTIDRRLTLACTCPDKVEITQSVTINAASDLAVTIDGCTVSKTAGFASKPAWPGCTAAPTDAGIVASGTGSVNLLVRDSVVAGWGAGIHLKAAGTASSLCVARSRVWGNCWGAGATQAPVTSASQLAECTGLPEGANEAVAVVSSQIDQNERGGVWATTAVGGVAVYASLITKNGTLGGQPSKELKAAGMGVHLLGVSSAHFVSNVIRDNLGQGVGARDGKSGIGYVVTKNAFVENHGATIAFRDLPASAEVKDNYIQVTKMSGKVGDGVHVVRDASAKFQVKVTANKLTGCERHSIFLHGVTGSVDGNTVVKSGMCGIHVQEAPEVVVGTNTIATSGMADLTLNPTTLELISESPMPPPYGESPTPLP